MNFSSELDAIFEHCIRDREDMHEYQDEIAVPFLKANPFSALFADLGLGKCVIAGTVVADNFDAGNWATWLIIGPKRVISQTWPEELREWRHLAHLTCASPFDKQYKRELKAAAQAAVKFERALMEIDEPDWDLPGDHMRMMGYWDEGKIRLRRVAEEARIVQSKLSIPSSTLRNPACIHLVSRDNIEHLVDAWGSERWPYKKIIIDESQSFKSYKSGRFKALKKVRKVIKRMHHLTATPNAESYEDLFAPIWLLDRGERLSSVITHFRKRYFRKDQSGYNWKLLPGMDEEIAKQIADICLTLRVEDYLDLEKPLYLDRKVKLGQKAMAEYQHMQRHLVHTMESGQKIKADSAGILQNKLLQMSSGFIYDDEKKWHHIHDAKIETLKELVEELDGEPLLVAYWFQPTLERLKKAFPQGVVMDDAGKYKAKWDKRQIPILFIHPASGGAGLNLQKGGHHLAIFDIFYSNELYTQLIGRLARQGQMHLVKVIHLVAMGTVDRIVLAALADKENGQEMLKNYIKNIRRGILDGSYSDIEDVDFETL